MNDPLLPPPRRSAPGLLTRILAVAVGALVLAGAVAISFVVFVIALVVILVIGVYVWWKTRHFRRQLREQLNAQRSDVPRGDSGPGDTQAWNTRPGDTPARNTRHGETRRGDIIEGEVIRKRDSDPRQH